MASPMTFRRREIKYLLEQEQYDRLKLKLQSRLTEDEYGKSTICNVYYDTPDYRLIRTSLEKPVYKEKLRLRSYGVSQPDAQVFVELKKKYKGIVYKRRETMTLAQSGKYLETGCAPQDTQIIREINWFLQYYGKLSPSMHISYEREAYYSKEDKGLRITFDENIQWRSSNLNLAAEVGGNRILKDGQHLMELKAQRAIPIWLTQLLDEEKLFPTSFSKYGRAYILQTLNF